MPRTYIKNIYGSGTYGATSTASAGGNLNTAREGPFGIGASLNSCLIATGYNNVSTSESYDGATWSNIVGGNVTSNQYVPAGCGIFNSALKAGGAGPSGGTAVATAETFNGSSWTGITSMNYARICATGFGTQSSANIIGGSNWGTTFYNYHEVWNGAAWGNSGGTLNGVRRSSPVTGTSSSAVTFNGLNSGSTDATNAETWNGSSWSVGITTLIPHTAGGISGTATSCTVNGGHDDVNNLNKTEIEFYNGTTSFISGNLSVGRWQVSCSNMGTVNSGIIATGDAPGTVNTSEHITTTLYDEARWVCQDKMLRMQGDGDVIVETDMSAITLTPTGLLYNYATINADVSVPLDVTDGATLYSDAATLEPTWGKAKAIDNSDSTSFIPNNTLNSGDHWLAMQLTASKTCVQTTVIGWTNGNHYRFKDFKIQASNNSTNGSDGSWTDLYSGTLVQNYNRQTFSWANTTSYAWYRWYGTNTFTNEYMGIGEIELMESTTAVLNFSLGDRFIMNMPMYDLTLTFSNPRVGNFLLKVTHETSARTLTFPTAYWVGETGTSAKGYSLSAGVTRYTTFSIFCDGTNYFISDIPYSA